MSLNLLKQIVKTNFPKADIDPIERAYFVAEKKLKGVKRDKMDYFDHLCETALIIARMKLNPETVTAALLHDLPHRTDYSILEITKDFGEGVGLLISSLDYLRSIDRRYKGTERYVESAKRMFVAVAKDFRVLLIKFAERLNNLQHLETFDPAQQKIMVDMTEKVYVPLLGVLGVWRLRWQMEDICFKYHQPQIYQKIYSQIEKGLSVHREEIVADVNRQITRQAKQYKIKCLVDTRFKHVAGVYRKMQEKKMKFNKIYDVFAVRIVTDTWENCYLLLGVVHSLWRPVPRRVKDYIAAPKPNSYQSLHTTVFSHDGYPMEFQIRTQQMHDQAQYGVAAHWYYKHPELAEVPPAWIKEMFGISKHYESASQKNQRLVLESLADTIFCYTPKGDIMELPRGSTPIDFAYAVGLNLGHHCLGAAINDLERPLGTELTNNDVIEIITSESAKPLKSWLKLVKTAKAEKEINKWFEENSRE